MLRIACLGLLAAMLSVLLGGAAFAHGGNWRQPGRPRPKASDPPTIAPPTPATPGPRPLPTRDPRRRRRGGGPTPTPRGKPTGRDAQRRLNVAEWQPGNWETWWDLNESAFLAAWKPRLTRAAVITPGERESPSAVPAPTVAERADAAARKVATSYLLSLIDPEVDTHPEMRSVALVAVGRSVEGEAPLAWILHHARSADASLEVRESAVLALGLLRRSEKARQLSAATIADARDALFSLIDDERAPVHLRAFAAFSLALLADQPYGNSAIERDGRLVARGLWLRQGRAEVPGELRIALLVALGHQPPTGVPTGVLQGLVRLASPRAQGAPDDFVRAHALAALVRLEAPDAFAAIRRALANAGEADCAKVAAAIGLAAQAARASPAERVEAVLLLRRHAFFDRPAIVQGFGMLAVGELLGADLRAGSHEVLRRSDAESFLERQVRQGSTPTRPYAALALGLAAHDVAPRSRQTRAFVDDAREAIHSGLRARRGADDVVGALAVAAGLARVDIARPLLLEILVNQSRGASLRGHAALALGQLGGTDVATFTALGAATEERISPFVHLQAVKALGLLDAPGSADLLTAQLEYPWTQRASLSPVAEALGRLRDPASTRLFIQLARDEGEPLAVRVASVMALGLTFDPEAHPSRVILTKHANYPSLTASLAQVFNIM